MAKITVKALIGFGGFGGPEIVLRKAGIETISIELDPAIAEVNRINGGNVITADILDIDPIRFLGYILMHFSPPCPPFSQARNSQAKQGMISRISDLAYHQSLVNGESELDIRFARKICVFIKICRPKFFTLENVWGYRKSQSWLMIWYTLLDEGYGVDAWNLNAANYGVPQTRRRMIVIARRDGRKPDKPQPTHAKPSDTPYVQMSMLDSPLQNWNGWYEAIEDLIPGLPDSEFAPWQLDRLGEKSKTFLMPVQGEGSGPIGGERPSPTITATHTSQKYRALLVPGDNTSNGVIRKADEPMVTITTRPPSRSPHRAFILGQGQRSRSKTGAETTDTIRAGLKGRVVSMTPRALARYQDFPDSFILPGEPGLIDNSILLESPMPDRVLACRGVGNALPPGLMRAVLRSLGIG